ncbi:MULTISPECIES: DNA sulfur modification protein DndB [unclassified Microbacterium]|uniref:DNA sulfur modification protein DndB n=1 Tax=unclassified Microbacterium TaxID=2609290 RepID=UPI000EA9B6AB|nr:MULTISPECIES: DNA sulfur modification protein DndB [unclassified Microbacterium]MBT2484759.1 hypothetical protein [Microbacterium sp. ISL-108]RKN67636.1 hypothetical protein D7252_08610 [Microbacterium sp. CGR2]
MAKTVTEPTRDRVVAGIATEEQTYATRYKQGGRTVFGLSLSPAQIVNMVPRPDPSVPNPGNRAIRENHAKAFADYYLSRESWVIPGIILRAPSIFKFDSEMEPSDGFAQWGVMSYPKRSASKIQILDGQHRILGFHIALQLIAQQIEKAQDFRARAMRAEHGDKTSSAVREAEAALRAARSLEDRFSSERVSVELQVTDDTREYRQMFFDIADNALGITASVRSRFDSFKVVNRALPTVLEHPLLDKRVDLENDRLKRNSSDYATARHVADIIRAVQVGLEGRIGKVQERILGDQKVAEDARSFLDLVSETFPQLEAMKIGQVSVETLRSTTLLGSPAMLRVLAGVYHDLMSEKHQWTREQVKDFFKVIEPHLLGGAHLNSIWINNMPNEAFSVNAFSPNGRGQDIRGIVKTLVDAAILGKKGAPWLWAEPKDAPPAPPTAEQESLDADLLADPALEQLLAANAEFEASMPKAGKTK